MLKRIIDILISSAIVFFTSQILLIFAILIWKYDNYSPLYKAPRVGKNFKIFTMIKLRSMSHNADKLGVNSTSNNDSRITPIGKYVRKFKIDEFTQMINVLLGDMSLVGPRPNVLSEVKMYTGKENNLLKVKPGVTDFSSIIFSDEGAILSDKKDPDKSYNLLIRPWKSRLGLFYIKKSSVVLDLLLILITGIAIFSRKIALALNTKILIFLNAPEELIKVSKRETELIPTDPP